MCGIGGILRTDGEPIPEEWLDAIDARIAYRGPDGQGRFRDRVEIDTPDGKRIVEIAFVHRRLSIIDHEDGAQPMVSQRGRNENEGLVAVVFNGCIYNHRELRQELEEKGHSFETDHSDTEVLIHGWREWKQKLIDHLEGMYAFAIWDREAASLYLARDWFGEKPLYLAESPDWSAPPVVGFASEPRAFLGCETGYRSDFRRVSFCLVEEYLRSGYSDGNDDETWCVGETYPGYAFTIGARDKEHQSRPKFSAISQASDEQHIEELIETATKRRLEADVPLGCFLSGGLDSSLIAHFAMQYKPDLQTFSVRMPDQRYDESAQAETVARHLGTKHTTLEVSMNPAQDLLDLIETMGQPFGDSSILPTYWVSKAAREHVKVALSGDGGDEMFVGYDRYMAARTLARHHRWLRFLPSTPMRRSHPKSPMHKLGRLVEMAHDFPTLGITVMESVFTQRSLAQLLRLPSTSGRGAEGEGETRTGHRYKHDPHPGEGAWYSPDAYGGDALMALRMFDIDSYLPGDLLRKVDTASMACALEVRCPFLDRDLARAVLAMPIEQLIPGGKRKGLLRRIARKYLPARIVDRPKMGFAIPIGEWFRSDYGGMKALLLDHLQSTDPFGPIDLSRKAVQRFIDEHMSGKRDHSQRLFTLLTLSIWAKSL